MAFKFITALAFVAVASAGVLPAPQVYHAAPQTVITKAVESYDSYPKYKFSYAVNDEHTGDVKSQVESRDGDLVQGEYSLIDSDGYKRTVQYTADHDHGFNAVVHREPVTVKAAPVIKAAPVAYSAAPALSKSAPLAYGQGLAAYATQSIVKSAPVAYAAAPSYSYHH